MSKYLVDDLSLTSVADAIRSKTGTSDDLSFPTGFVSAISDISTGGGNSIQIGDNTYPMSLEAMFYALENGTGASGVFTLVTALPNTETLIVETGLSEIHGLMFLIEGFPTEHEDAGWQRVGFSVSTYENDVVNTQFCINKSGTASNGITVVRGDIRIDGGNVYCTANYNANERYTPFAPGFRYRWVAW